MIIKELRYTEQQIFRKLNYENVKRGTIKHIDFSLREIYRRVIYDLNEKDITLFNTTIFLLSDTESSSEMEKYVMPIANSVKDICILVSQDNILTSILTHVVHMVHRNGNYIYILNTKSGVRLSNNLRILNIGHSLIHTFDDEKYKKVKENVKNDTKKKKKMMLVDKLLIVTIVVFIIFILLMINQPFIGDYLNIFI